MNLKQLLEARAAKLAEMQAAHEAGDAAKFDAAEAEVRALDAKITEAETRQQKMAAMTEAGKAAEQRAKQPTTAPVTESRPMVTTSAEPRQIENLGEYLDAVMRSSRPGASMHPVLAEQRAALEHRAPTGMGLSIPSLGGFLMQPKHSQQIVEKMHGVGKLMNLIDWVDLEYGYDSMAYPFVDESSRADGARRGGIRGYWVDEAATITASKPKLGSGELKLKKVAALVYLTGEMQRNLPAFGQKLGQWVAEELVFRIEDSLVNGSGAGCPRGLLSQPSKIEVSKETGQAADSLVAENIINMWARLAAECRPNAVWLINQDVMPHLDKLALSVGVGGQLVYLDKLTAAPAMMLKGRPVIESEYADTIGDAGDIILFDPKQFVAIRRASLLAASSIHVQFLTDQEVFRFITEVDADIPWTSALTPFKTTTTVSPVVTLAARA